MEQDLEWQVIYGNFERTLGVHVRKAKDLASDILGVKVFGDTVRGKSDSEWLALTPETGYMKLTGKHGQKLLQKVSEAAVEPRASDSFFMDRRYSDASADAEVGIGYGGTLYQIPAFDIDMVCGKRAIHILDIWQIMARNAKDHETDVLTSDCTRSPSACPMNVCAAKAGKKKAKPLSVEQQPLKAIINEHNAEMSCDPRVLNAYDRSIDEPPEHATTRHGWQHESSIPHCVSKICHGASCEKSAGEGQAEQCICSSCSCTKPRCGKQSCDGQAGSVYTEKACHRQWPTANVDFLVRLQLGGGAPTSLIGVEGLELPLELWGTATPEPMQIEEVTWNQPMPTIRAQSLKEIKVSNRTPLLFGSHDASDVRTGAAPLTGALFRIGDKLFFRPLVDETWLCLQDIGVRIPLRNGQRMELRLADGIAGCTIKVEARDCTMLVMNGTEVPETLDPEGSQHDHLSSEGAMIFQGSFDIGRGRGRPHAYCKAQEQGFKRCAVSRSLDYVPKYLACFRKDGSGSGGFWLEPHCDDMRRDPERLRSTWLRLSQSTAYYLPTGAREEHVALSIGGELFVVTSNTHDQVRSPTHEPHKDLNQSGNMQLFRRIAEVLGQNQAMEFGRACSMIRDVPVEVASGSHDDVQPILEKVHTRSTVAPRVLDRCRCCDAVRAAFHSVPVVAPNVQHAILTLSKRHGLSGYYRGVLSICDVMGVEDVTDLEYFAEDPEMFLKFTKMCDRFPMGCIESLVEEVRNTPDLKTLAAKPDVFDDLHEFPFDVPGSVGVRYFSTMLAWCAGLPASSVGSKRIVKEVVLGDAKRIEECCELLPGEIWERKPLDLDGFVRLGSTEGVLAVDGHSGQLIAKVQFGAEHQAARSLVDPDATRHDSICGVANVLGHDGGLVLVASEVGPSFEVMVVVHQNVFIYSGLEKTWTLRGTGPPALD